jgi:hypothetical protein
MGLDELGTATVQPLGDMSSQEFRAYGEWVLDWIARYL